MAVAPLSGEREERLLIVQKEGCVEDLGNLRAAFQQVVGAFNAKNLMPFWLRCATTPDKSEPSRQFR